MEFQNKLENCHHKWQPIHGSFTLRVTIEPIGQLDWFANLEFNA